MEYRVRRRHCDGGGPCSAASIGRGIQRPTAEQIITDAAIRRFLLRAGFRTSSERVVIHTRKHLLDFVDKLLDSMFVYVTGARCMRVRLIDVMQACRFHGIRVYGYDDVCILTSSGGEETTFHVTEMVESQTAFSSDPKLWIDEPDFEPGARFKKTNFVQNYIASNWEDDEDSDDPEWSWYGDSDADSDSTEEEENKDGDFDMDSGCKSSKPRPWELPRKDENQFVDSLEAAQALVDEQLLDTGGSDLDEDSAPGQGYHSDYDDIYEPQSLAKANADAQEEDKAWNISNNTNELEEKRAQRVVQAMLLNDDASQYIIPRQVFGAFYHRMTEQSFKVSLEISSVALSALHNATEQCLHRALTEGVLSYQLRVMIMEEEASRSENELQEQLQREQEKVNKQQKLIADLKASFSAKELAMQQQIAELQHQVRIQQQGDEDVHMQTPTRTPGKRKSPGKHKATSNSSLRSKLQDYALRSKKCPFKSQHKCEGKRSEQAHGNAGIPQKRFDIVMASVSHPEWFISPLLPAHLKETFAVPEWDDFVARAVDDRHRRLDLFDDIDVAEQIAGKRIPEIERDAENGQQRTLQDHASYRLTQTRLLYSKVRRRSRAQRSPIAEAQIHSMKDDVAWRCLLDVHQECECCLDVSKARVFARLAFTDPVPRIVVRHYIDLLGHASTRQELARIPRSSLHTVQHKQRWYPIVHGRRQEEVAPCEVIGRRRGLKHQGRQHHAHVRCVEAQMMTRSSSNGARPMERVHDDLQHKRSTPHSSSSSDARAQYARENRVYRSARAIGSSGWILRNPSSSTFEREPFKLKQQAGSSFLRLTFIIKCPAYTIWCSTNMERKKKQIRTSQNECGVEADVYRFNVRINAAASLSRRDLMEVVDALWKAMWHDSLRILKQSTDGSRQ
ncbi:hypothetical protein FI667_g6248, partial [Globisporangium splendens]